MPVNRYKQLLASVPRGGFYSANGQILPYRGSLPYQLRITANYANHEYDIFVNDIFRGSTVTDVDSIAVLSIVLDKGLNEIVLVGHDVQDKIISLVSTRDYATIMAAHASILDQIDADADQVLDESRIETATTSLIETVFGVPVHTANPQYALDTYREMLQEIRAAYRYWGGTIQGIGNVVASFTHVNPLLYKRSFGPAWMLGRDLIRPKTDVVNHTYYTTSAIDFAPPTGALTLKSIGGRVGIGSASINYIGTTSPKTIGFTSPGGVAGDQINITGVGDYTLYDGLRSTNVIGFSSAVPLAFHHTSYLALEIGGRGRIDIEFIPQNYDALAAATTINNALVADPRYGADFNAFAAVLPVTGRLVLSVPTSIPPSSIIIHPVIGGVDAAQALFDISPIRAQLGVGISGGDTVLQLSPAADLSLWPDASVDAPLRIMVGRTLYLEYGGDIGAAYSDYGCVADAIAIDTVANTITLADPIDAEIDADTTVELYDQITYIAQIVGGTKHITVTVNDMSGLPAADVTLPFTVDGTGVPDGWIVSHHDGSVAPACTLADVEYFDGADFTPIRITGLNGRLITIPIPDDILKYNGFNLLCSIWLSNDYTMVDNASVDSIEISFDGGTTYSSSGISMSAMGREIPATSQPRQIKIETRIPYNATGIYIRVYMSDNGGDVYLHKVRVAVPSVHDGLFLGSGTTPRNESKIKTGHFIYVWSPDELSSLENSLLGLDSVVQSNGHIDKISPANIWLEKFDVTTYTGGVPNNIHGVFSETDFSNGSATNLNVVLRTPSRFTHLKPSTVSEHTETVVWSTANKYQLSYVSDGVVADTIVFEDGIPLDTSEWQFVGSDIIEILKVPNLDVEYQVRYNALIRFTTGTIDLGANYADYLWFADYHIYNRPEASILETNVNVGLSFDGSGVATLDERSNGDKTTAVLTEDNGVGTRTIPQSQWDFIGIDRVRIDLTTFNPEYLYSITHIAEVNDVDGAATVDVEIRSGQTVDLMLAAAFTSASINSLVNQSHRYHQMRVTLSNVRDVRDVRVQSLLLKGLNMFGVGGSVPVIR